MWTSKPQMPNEEPAATVAIDRATRGVFIQVKPHKTAAAAQAFLKAVHRACPIRITNPLTENEP